MLRLCRREVEAVVRREAYAVMRRYKRLRLGTEERPRLRLWLEERPRLRRGKTRGRGYGEVWVWQFHGQAGR
jgi:hypothetical protein